MFKPKPKHGIACSDGELGIHENSPHSHQVVGGPFSDLASPGYEATHQPFFKSIANLFFLTVKRVLILSHSLSECIVVSLSSAIFDGHVSYRRFRRAHKSTRTQRRNFTTISNMCVDRSSPASFEIITVYCDPAAASGAIYPRVPTTLSFDLA